MQVVANIKPCLLDDHPNYNEVAGKQGFIVETRTQLPVKEPFWDGMGSHVDFTHPAGIAWWQQRLKGQVLDWGIDVGWNDNNEYALLDEDAVSHGFGQSIPMHRSRPLHALLMTRATFEAQQERTPDTPVFTVTRAGPPGIQRYAQTWSGDNSTSWHTLRWNIRTGLQMSLSGMFNIGHDVGGFFGPVPSPELLLRWVQACCLNPRMVMNSWKDDGTVNLPWMHPEVTDLVIQAIRLRYTLLPTLWACMEHAHTAHEPILRPTFYNFPTDDHCLEDSDDFMLGANLLVAPVVEPGQRERQVYMPALPKGQLQEWVAFDSGERYAAGQTHTLPAPLHRLPLLVRAGAQLPIAEFASGELPRQDTGRTILRSF
jgi:alpha-glucosidase